MPPGKLSAQAGHAYGDVLDLARQISPERTDNYRNPDKGGSKVTLKARNQNQLINAYNAAVQAGIPAKIVVDRDHVLLPHFTGEPVITALGIGPCKQAEVRHITKKFNCV
ncbi:peptidyl-tRNA hydrolase [Pseudoalteromonas sp. OFAV1]|jgi:PTH2 family peptidyl-tRNA hydrolase|nr:peptidyl-tRNA hydrolase [Pseudoalteromonas sp. OFAV1]